MIDLIANTGQECIGFCIIRSKAPRRRDWLPLVLARQQGLINRGFLLYQGSQAFSAAQGVLALPIGDFAREIDQWIHHRRRMADAHEPMERINTPRQLRMGRGPISEDNYPADPNPGIQDQPD